MLVVQNVKLGFATNSSSYHTIILNPDQEIEPWNFPNHECNWLKINGDLYLEGLLEDNNDFGRGYGHEYYRSFQSSHKKAQYAYLQALWSHKTLKSAQKDLKTLRKVIEDFTQKKVVFQHEVGITNPQEYEDAFYAMNYGHIDHQSVGSLKSLFKDPEKLKQFIFSDAYLVIISDEDECWYFLDKNSKLISGILVEDNYENVVIAHRKSKNKLWDFETIPKKQIPFRYFRCEFVAKYSQKIIKKFSKKAWLDIWERLNGIYPNGFIFEPVYIYSTDGKLVPAYRVEKISDEDPFNHKNLIVKDDKVIIREDEDIVKEYEYEQMQLDKQKK